MQNSTPMDKEVAPDNPILVSRERASFLLGLSIRSIDYLVAKGELKPVRRIGRRILIPYAALVAWARRDHPECFQDGKE